MVQNAKRRDRSVVAVALLVTVGAMLATSVLSGGRFGPALADALLRLGIGAGLIVVAIGVAQRRRIARVIAFVATLVIALGSVFLVLWLGAFAVYYGPGGLGGGGLGIGFAVLPLWAGVVLSVSLSIWALASAFVLVRDR
jgi:hypothetical protein